MIETALEWICVENGMEVKIDLCKEEIDALKQLVYPSASTGVIFTPIPLDQLPAYNATGTTISTGKTTTGASVSGESKMVTNIKKDIS